jgi:prostaglandin E receptor 3
MAIRLASLNQILDPWVYLLLREILLRKFCMVANAMSNCSIERRNENQVALTALHKDVSPEADCLQKQQTE